MTEQEKFKHYTDKKASVLRKIEPICSAYGISNFDYIIDLATDNEKLVIEGTAIGCCGNSVSAVVDELTAYIFVTRYCKNRSLGAFEKQTLKHIKSYWL